MPAGKLNRPPTPGPAVCGKDPAHTIEPHCVKPPSPTCTWIRCTDPACKAVTGLVLGRPHVAGTPSEWIGSGPAAPPTTEST